MPDEQTPGQKIDAALQELKEASANAGVILAVQGAMGWMFKGDMEQARAALVRRVPRERLAEVSMAAAALSSLADEIAAEPGEPR
jgi:hypothetical protein